MSIPRSEADRGPIASAVQEKVNEYRVLIAPVEQAIRELQFAQGMLRAKAEEEIHALSPALETLSEALGISTLDLLLAKDRAAFLEEAVARAQVPVEEVRRRLLDAEGREHLKALGLPEAA